MPEAFALVKTELGPEAVILGTRTLPEPGLGWLTGRERVEITAAPPEAVSPAPRLAVRPAAALPAATHAAQADPRVGRSSVGDVLTDKARLRGVPPTPERAPGRGSEPALPQYACPYLDQLVQSGMGEDPARRLIEDALCSVPQHVRRDPRALGDILRGALARRIQTIELAVAAGSGRRVALVGPPGSGKTTALVKLATFLQRRKNCRVGLLGLDAHRLAAREQLQRYAEIVGTPVQSVQAITDVKPALAQLSECDAVLIDTPGVGPRDQGRFARLAALLRALRPEEVHLVLPVWLTPAVLVRIAESFAPLGVARVILTRLDEAAGYGALVNVMARLRWPLSFWTAGQNVPQDLEVACSRRLAELILPRPSLA